MFIIYYILYVRFKSFNFTRGCCKTKTCILKTIKIQGFRPICNYMNILCHQKLGFRTR